MPPDLLHGLERQRSIRGVRLKGYYIPEFFLFEEALSVFRRFMGTATSIETSVGLLRGLPRFFGAFGGIEEPEVDSETFQLI